MVTIHLGHLRRELFNSTPPTRRNGTSDIIATANGGTDDPSAIPSTSARPAPGTLTLSAVIDAHTPARTVLAPEVAQAVQARSERRRLTKGRHKWRPTDPVEWRPIPRLTPRDKDQTWRVDA